MVDFTPPPIYAYDDDDDDDDNIYLFVSPPLLSFVPWLHVSASTTIGNILYKHRALLFQ